MDDQRRKLQVVNAANPSLRLSVAPPTPQPQLRVGTAAPQRLYLPGGNSYVDRDPNMATERPKQIKQLPNLSFAQKLRDTFDANTESDRIKRVNNNQPEMYDKGNAFNQSVRLGKEGGSLVAAPFQPFAKGLARLLPGGQNDLKALDEQQAQIDRDSAHWADLYKSGKISKESYSKMLNSLSNQYQGVSKSAQQIVDETPSASQVVASAAMVPLSIFAPGAGLVRNAAFGTVAGGVTAATNKKELDAKDIGIGATVGGVLGTAGTLIGKGVSKVAGKYLNKPISKEVTNLLIDETNPETVKSVLSHSLNIGADQLDDVAVKVAESTTRRGVDDAVKTFVQKYAPAKQLFEDLANETNPVAIKQTLGGGVPDSYINYIAEQTDPNVVANILHHLEVDPSVTLTDEVRNRLTEAGIRSVKQDPSIPYEAQYQDGNITARGQKELDANVYHELGHHLYDTKLTPEEKALFKGAGNASKEAIGRPGYTQDNVNAEDFADYLNKALNGQIDEVPKEYQSVIRKYAKIAESQANDVASTGRVNSVANKDLVNQGLTGSRVTTRKLKDLPLGSDALGDVDPAQVQDYVNRINAGDNIDPVIVSKGSDGKFYVVDGKHRLEAMKQVGITDVPTVEVPPKNSGITNADIIAAKETSTGVGDIQDATAKATGETTTPAPATAGETSVAPQVSSNQATVTQDVSKSASERTSILKPQPEVIPSGSGTARPAGFAQSLSQTSTPQAVYEDLLEITTKPNPQTFAQASQDIVANEQAILMDILGKSKGTLNDVDNARALLLLDKAIADDNIPLATQLASKVNSSATENARAVQILSAIDKTTPAGAFKEAQKIVTEAQEKGLLPQDYVIPADKLASINERAKAIQGLEIGSRDHELATGLLLADLKSIVPPTIGDKLNSVVNISLLLNPKTFIRNVLGNTAGAVGETVSTTVSTPIDMLLSLRTGKRTVALPSVIERFGGFGKGLSEGFQETNLGIRIGTGGKYDINTPVFKNKVGQWVEKALGHSLSDLDKAFATSQYMDTLNSLMKAAKVTKPTQEMLDIAGHEALYATYQGDSFIAKSLQGAKGWLNKANVKGFGLGDVVVRYPKTPGNLVAVGMDYSPYGFVKGLVQAVKLNQGSTLAAQREAVRNIGRGLTGSGLIAGGYYLAKNNIITAKKSSDKDLNSLQRQQGTPPFSFNISALNRLIKGEDTTAREGDVITNYDWLQPNAIQLSMGANMALNKDKGANDWISTTLDQAATGLETIEEQPVLAQTGRFFKTAATPADQGGGIPNAIVDSVTGLPSMFVPSVVNQTAASLDNTARTTYDPNPAKMGLNKVVGKLPFANQTLEPAIDTFGNEIKRQQSDNPITRVFNSFINPAFVTKIQRTPEGQMVLDIYNRSGETGQIPRVAAKKQSVNLDGGEGSTASSYTLSGKELTEFQKLTGKLAKETFAELANNPAFMALPDDQKAAEMQKKLTEINSYAKITVLGNKPKTMSEGVKALISGRVGDFASKSPENVTGIAKQYYDKTAYMDDATYKAWLNGEPDQVAKDTAAELNKKRPANTNELGAYNGLAKRFAEYEKAKADAKKDGTWSKLDEVEKDQEFWKGAIKDGKENLTKDIYDAGSSGAKDYWEKGYIVKEDIDKAIALDNELYASGLSKTLKFSKKFRNLYGYGVPTSPDGKSSGGSGGGKGGRKGSKSKEVTVQGLNERKLRFDPSPAPDVSAVPSTAKKKLKFNVPSSVQVTPVRLKL